MAATKKYLDRLNYGKVVLRVDPEPSTLDLQKSVIERPNTTPQQSPKGSKGSLGGAEGGHTQVEGQFRAQLFELEKGLGKKIPLNHKIIPWMAKHTGWLLNRYQPHAADGITSHERLLGKPYVGDTLIIGEGAMFKLRGRRRKRMPAGRKECSAEKRRRVMSTSI